MADPTPTEPRPAATAKPGPLRTTPSLIVAGLHLLVLSAFGIAQPLLNLLGKYPAFFAAHNDSSLEVIAFALALVFGPPLVMLALEGVAGLVDIRARAALHLLFITGLAALFFLQAVRKIFESPGWLPFAVALALGAAVAALYATEAVARSLLSFLSPAPLVFLVLFIFFAPVSKLTLGGSAEAYDVVAKTRPPIFFIVFDAFPEKLIWDRQHRIDPVRFPNLARLNKDATWYRNATTADENTVFSVPSILDGKFPRKGLQPIVADHPNSLFTLLGKGYEMNVTEVATNLCPAGLCRRTDNRTWGSRVKLMASDVSVVYQYLTLPASMQDRLPSIGDRWQDFQGQDSGDQAGGNGKPSAKGIISQLKGGKRPDSFERAVAEIRPGRPQLNFLHILLPHEPREYLPDGRRYPAGMERDPATEDNHSYDNQFLSEQGWQRDILQSQYVDRLVGQLVARLKEKGLYDKAMVVLIADHGESFRTKATPAPGFVPGKLSYRRAVTPENIQDIAPIPLIIKYPGTGRGKVDDRWVKTIDVLPTIAATLGIKLPFRVDGRSLLDPAYRGRSEVRVERTSGPDVVMGIPAFERRREDAFQHQLDLFGSGSDTPGLYGIGPNRQLVGRSVSSLSVSPPDAVRATIQAAGVWANVDPNARTVPAQVTGTIEGGPPENRDLAAAVNGRIVAVGRSFKDLGAAGINFSFMLPETAIRRGANRLEIFQVTPGAGLRLLARAGSGR